MTQTLTPVKPARLIINGEHVDASSGEQYERDLDFVLVTLGQALLELFEERALGGIVHQSGA